jgi:hypothetical protein
MTRAEASFSGGKQPAMRYSKQWLDGDLGALAAALKREKARGGMALAHRPRYI